MILVDTSVWIDHLHRTSPDLVAALERAEVLTHPFVTGELACGALKNREEILRLIETLPSAPVASHEEAMTLLEHRKLMGRGIGYIDIHLLASASLGHDVALWTTDRKLHAIAVELKLAAAPAP